jgi:hypothetical protein
MNKILTSANPSITKQMQTPNHMMMVVAYFEKWMSALFFIGSSACLIYLWTLVHFSNENTVIYKFKDVKVENDNDLGEVYTVYTCVLLLLTGISVLWLSLN